MSLREPAFEIESELRRWGPGADYARPSLRAAERYCRELARSHYENFPVVSWLLPRRLRGHVRNVYAFCRWADDLGDELSDRQRSLELLDWWQQELEACYDGRSRHPVFVALASTIQRFDVAITPFQDLIGAFRQDQHIREYRTFDELLEYCTRSANPVGRIVLRLTEHETLDAFRLSDSICTGLQLANFWQDVARDLDRGHIYLPREDRERFGFGDEQLHSRVTNDAFIALMAFEVDRARGFLVAGLPLAETLPFRLRIDVDLFASGGLRVLDRVDEIGYRVWETRPIVSNRDVAGLFSAAFWRASRAGLRRHISGRDQALYSAARK